MKRWFMESGRRPFYPFGQARRRRLKGKAEAASLIAGLIASAYAASVATPSPDDPDFRNRFGNVN
jgi:hypothetical protein